MNGKKDFVQGLQSCIFCLNFSAFRHQIAIAKKREEKNNEENDGLMGK